MVKWLRSETTYARSRNGLSCQRRATQQRSMFVRAMTGRYEWITSITSLIDDNLTGSQADAAGEMFAMGKKFVKLQGLCFGFPVYEGLSSHLHGARAAGPCETLQPVWRWIFG